MLENRRLHVTFFPLRPIDLKTKHCAQLQCYHLVLNTCSCALWPTQLLVIYLSKYVSVCLSSIYLPSHPSIHLRAFVALLLVGRVVAVGRINGWLLMYASFMCAVVVVVVFFSSCGCSSPLLLRHCCVVSKTESVAVIFSSASSRLIIMTHEKWWFYCCYSFPFFITVGVSLFSFFLFYY